MAEEQHVVAVIVTWNRRELLAEALAAVRAQTRPPDRVIVVDNASTDGTAELLATPVPTVDVLRTRVNLGGAGGFALGVRAAVADAPRALLWLMDDDTVPEPAALSALLDARTSYPGPPPALVASRVVWTDGRDHPMNTPRAMPWAGRASRSRAATAGSVAIRSASFVSVLVDGAVVRERGLPIADYFLWNDDFEFTTRLIRGNVGLSCPRSVVVHKTRAFAATDREPGERFYYEVRNKAWAFTRSSGLNPLEKAVYGGRTALRWASTIARSHDRRTLLGCLVRGLRHGLLSAPRPTAEVLAGAVVDRGEVADRSAVEDRDAAEGRP